MVSITLFGSIFPVRAETTPLIFCKCFMLSRSTWLNDSCRDQHQKLVCSIWNRSNTVILVRINVIQCNSKIFSNRCVILKNKIPPLYFLRHFHIYIDSSLVERMVHSRLYLLSLGFNPLDSIRLDPQCE